MNFNEVMNEIKTSGKRYTNGFYENGECIYYVPEQVDEENNVTSEYIAFEYFDNNKVKVVMQYMAGTSDIFATDWREVV